MYGTPSDTFDPIRDLPNLAGKVILVTGSSSGIGLATLQHLSRMGAKTVYMATPKEKMTEDTLSCLEQERKEQGYGEILWHELDLKDPRTAKESAERFMKRESRLDILINNAALINDLGKPTLNEFGIQDNMAINYLGPYVFTRTLLPLLKSTASLERADVRIVNVGSAGYVDISSSQLKYGSIEGWNQKFQFSLLPSLNRYKYSKVAVHLWANNLARRMTFSESEILVLIVQPGAILSDGAKRALQKLPFPLFWMWLMSLWMSSQTKGAYTSVFAATAPRDNEHISNGAYIYPPNIAMEQKPHVLDVKKQLELLDYTEELLTAWGL